MDYKSKKEITSKGSAIIFVVSFLLSQFIVLLFALLWATFGSMFGIKVSNSISFLNNNPYGYLITTIVLDIILVSIFLFYNKRYSLNAFKKPNKTTSILVLFIAAVALLTLTPIVNVFTVQLIKIGFEPSQLPYELTTKNFIISIFSLVLLPAIAEELLFRGVIFKGLKKNGAVFSIIISAIMFSLFHASITQTLYPLLFGLILGVIMYKTGNIIYCIVMHVVNNLLSLTISYLKINLYSSHTLYTIFAVLMFIVWLAVISYIIIRNRNKNKEKLLKTDLYAIIISLGIMSVIWIASCLIGN